MIQVLPKLVGSLHSEWSSRRKDLNIEKEAMIPGCTVTDREKLFGKLTADTLVFSY